MKEYIIRDYSYKCNCGYKLNVFIDFGLPQELIKCRKCKNDIKRESQ